MKYYRDKNTDVIVRKTDDGMHVEYIDTDDDDFASWIPVEADSLIDSKYRLDEGNTSLIEISEEEADSIISSQNNSQKKEEETRRRLLARAWEYLMFMDDDD